jgi:HlyD family secretion protein
MEQYRIDYNIAWKNKNYTRIVSPASGVVFAIEVKPTDLVGVAKPLFVIAEDLKKMYLTISVDESDIGRIARGQKVTFTVSAFPTTTFEGKIDQVRFSPINTEGIVTYQAIVICDNRDQLLKPGMTATATIIIGVKANVKRIPNEAFIVSPVETKPDPGKKYLWKKVRMKVDQVPLKRVQVNTGLVGDYYTEILSDSVKTGDQVLVRIDKKFKLKDNI